jgi:modulator of FtsH protease
MSQSPFAVAAPAESILATNKLIRNTYALLSMTLIFSALMAGVSMAVRAPFGISIACSIGAIILVWFVIPKYRNSTAAVPLTFLFTGLLGFGLGPTLTYYVTAFSNGTELIMTAAGGTGAIFLGLSGYVLTSRKDFSFLGGFLFIGLIVGILGGIAAWIFNIPSLHLAISAMMILVASGLILYDTSRIIRGGETNYVMATISLFLDIIILFQHLLHLLGVFGGDD